MKRSAHKSGHASGRSLLLAVVGAILMAASFLLYRSYIVHFKSSLAQQRLAHMKAEVDSYVLELKSTIQHVHENEKINYEFNKYVQDKSALRHGSEYLHFEIKKVLSEYPGIFGFSRYHSPTNTRIHIGEEIPKELLRYDDGSYFISEPYMRNGELVIGAGISTHNVYTDEPVYDTFIFDTDHLQKLFSKSHWKNGDEYYLFDSRRGKNLLLSTSGDSVLEEISAREELYGTEIGIGLHEFMPAGNHVVGIDRIDETDWMLLSRLSTQYGVSDLFGSFRQEVLLSTFFALLGILLFLRSVVRLTREREAAMNLSAFEFLAHAFRSRKSELRAEYLEGKIDDLGYSIGSSLNIATGLIEILKDEHKDWSASSSLQILDERLNEISRSVKVLCSLTSGDAEEVLEAVMSQRFDVTSQAASFSELFNLYLLKHDLKLRVSTDGGKELYEGPLSVFRSSFLTLLQVLPDDCSRDRQVELKLAIQDGRAFTLQLFYVAKKGRRFASGGSSGEIERAMSVVQFELDKVGGKALLERDGLDVNISFSIPVNPIKTSMLEKIRESTAVLSMPSRILLVEDGALNRKVILHVLEKMGCSVISVGDGDEAVELFESGEEFDLVLMDLQMPRMNGMDATKKIREIEEHGANKHVPIVALTAHAKELHGNACKEAGMDGYMLKPINKAQLVRVVGYYTKDE